MAVSTAAIVANADLFRRAYPHWPYPETERSTGMPCREPIVHPCPCPPGEVVVVMPVELDGVMHEFLGAGPDESEADWDAERHATDALGWDCVRYPSRPA